MQFESSGGAGHRYVGQKLSGRYPRKAFFDPAFVSARPNEFGRRDRTTRIAKEVALRVARWAESRGRATHGRSFPPIAPLLRSARGMPSNFAVAKCSLLESW